LRIDEVICFGDNTERIFPLPSMARLASREERRRAVRTWGWEENFEARRDHSAMQRCLVWGMRAVRRGVRREGEEKYQMQWLRTT
jgi:hypothetical protein